jgi:hypothetical protein
LFFTDFQEIIYYVSEIFKIKKLELEPNFTNLHELSFKLKKTMNSFKNKTFASLMGICVLCVTSCHPVYYQPTTQHTPLFTQKGELYVSSNFQGGDNVSGYNMHVAYATSAHWAVGLNGNFVGPDLKFLKKGVTTPFPNKSNFGEVNVGYFKASVDKQYIFEIYGGVGAGYIENHFNMGMSAVHLTRLSLQPTVAWRKKYTALIFSSRFSFLNYEVQKNTFRNLDWLQKTNRLNNQMITLWEPAFMFRVGGESIKGFAQIITSAEFTSKENSFLYNPDSIHIGITVNLNTL